MGNSFGKSRLINLVKSKFINQPKLNWPVATNLPQPKQRQLVPAKITALIPYTMPPNKPRAAKVAVVSIEKMKPEEKAEANGDVDNEVGETMKQATKGRKKAAPKENGVSEKPKSTRGGKAEAQVEEAAAEAPKATGRTRKKVAIEEAPEDAEPEPKKTGRGRKKEAAKEEDIDEEPPKRAGRGRKKAEPVENGDKVEAAKEDEAAKEVEAEPPKKAGRGRKKAEPSVAIEEKAEEDVAKEDEVEEPVPKKAVRGKKKAEPVVNEEKPEEDMAKKDEVQEEAPKKAARGKKKVEPVVNEEKAEEDTAKEAEVEEEAPKRTGRGRKKAESVENSDESDKEATKVTKGRKKVAEKSEEAEEKPTRGRKKATPTAEAAEGDEAEKPVAKRGRKAKVEEAIEEADASDASSDVSTKRGRVLTPIEEDEAPEEKPPAKRGRKAAVKKTGKGKKTEMEDGEESAEPSTKKAKTDDDKPKTNLDEIDFSCEKTNAKGEKFNLKICCWNVAGIRAVQDKLGIQYCLKEDADILLLQETKCDVDKLPEEWDLPGYKRYYVDSEKSGYAGVVMYTKKEPLNIKYGLENGPCEDEGRLITAEYDNYYVINVYVPNAGRSLVNLATRLNWNEAFKRYVKELDEQKPVIICGDMNVAHTEIDLANPKTNTKNAGFSPEEREGMTDLLGAGFVDTFRQLYPDKTGAYTFWSYMRASRSKNVGWRLDYFIVSERIKDNICDNVMRSNVLGSDHCPIVLYANL